MPNHHIVLKNLVQTTLSRSGRFVRTVHPALLIAIFLAFSASLLYAAPPASKYAPGETLDPTCGPGDVNCSVEIGSSLWSENGVDIYYNEGNVGVGTGTPNTVLDVDGALSMRGMTAPAVSPVGQGRIYFDSTSNTFKASENGAAYVDILGGGGGGTSLWTLHGNGTDIYRNVGNVGVNTDTPEFQFESTSDTVAARFRGEPGNPANPYDLDKRMYDYFFEVDPNCTPTGVQFSSDGLKMLMVGYCGGGGFGNMSVHEYDLGTPWDISSAVDTGDSYDPEVDTGWPPLGVEFSSDGTKMFVLNHNYTDQFSEIHQYTLSIPWDIGSVTYDGIEHHLPAGVEPLDNNRGSSFEFNATGTKLFFIGSEYDVVEGYYVMKAFEFELPVAWNVSTVVSNNIEIPLESDDGTIYIRSEGPFTFSSDGESAFGIFREQNSDTGQELYTINEYTFGVAWSLATINGLAAKYTLFESDGFDRPDYAGITFRPDGMGFFITEQEGDFTTNGIHQYSLVGETIGGDVIVDGDLAVGNTNPAYKLHVTSTGNAAVAAFSNGNAACTIDPSTSSMTCSSDRRLKTDINYDFRPSMGDSSLSQLMQLKPATYTWITEAGKNSSLRYGLIAQDVQSVFPELVSESSYLDPENPALGKALSVSYGGFVPFFIDAIQELNDKVDLAMLQLSLNSGADPEEIGGSLVDIIVRALKGAVLNVKELVAGTVRTKTLCLEDGSGETCIDRSRLNDLLGEPDDDHNDETNNSNDTGNTGSNQSDGTNTGNTGNTGDAGNTGNKDTQNTGQNSGGEDSNDGITTGDDSADDSTTPGPGGDGSGDNADDDTQNNDTTGGGGDQKDPNAGTENATTGEGGTGDGAVGDEEI